MVAFLSGWLSRGRARNALTLLVNNLTRVRIVNKVSSNNGGSWVRVDVRICPEGEREGCGAPLGKIRYVFELKFRLRFIGIIVLKMLGSYCSSRSCISVICHLVERKSRYQLMPKTKCSLFNRHLNNKWKKSFYINLINHLQWPYTRSSVPRVWEKEWFSTFFISRYFSVMIINF